MKQPIEEKNVLTTHEAAKLLYVTPTTVIQWIKEGKIKAVRTCGGHRRILMKEIKKLKTELGYNEFDIEETVDNK